MTAKDSAQFLALETALHKREVRSSAEHLSRLLADDFIEFGSSGRVFSKSAIIQSLSQEEGELSVSVEDFAASELAADVVLVTYLANKQTLRSSIWKKIGGRWQMIFHQGTRIS
jgi:hypothetical protein